MSQASVHLAITRRFQLHPERLNLLLDLPASTLDLDNDEMGAGHSEDGKPVKPTALIRYFVC